MTISTHFIFMSFSKLLPTISKKSQKHVLPISSNTIASLKEKSSVKNSNVLGRQTPQSLAFSFSEGSSQVTDG